MYPILFEFEGMTVYALWFFIAVGFVVGSLTFVHLAKRSRLKLDLVADHSFFLFICTLVFARLFFIALHFDLYFYQFSAGHLIGLVKIWDKGLSFWGAVIGWSVGMWYIFRKEKALDMLPRFFDILLPSLFVGMFFGNIGAFLDGINYGTPSQLPWAMSFSRSASVKYIAPIHPTQLYSAFYTLTIGLALILFLRKASKSLPGLVTEVGIFLFSFFKVLEEFFRGDDAIKIASFRLSQIIAFLVLLGSAYLLYLRYTNTSGKDPERVMQKTLRDFARNIKGRFTKGQLRKGSDQAESNDQEVFEKTNSPQNQAP